MPGHYGVKANEILDILAKQAACFDFVGPEPAIKLYSRLMQCYIRQ